MTMDINNRWKWYHHIRTRTKFNPMNIEQINKISLTELLSELGCMPIKKRRNTVYFNSPFYNDNKNSFEVDIVKNVWHDRGLNKGGDVISFGRLWHKSNNVEKVIDEFEKYEHLIIGHELSVKPIPKHDADEMIMISCNRLCNHALLSYLRSRGIDINEAKIFAKEIIYRIEEKNYVALAFKTIYGGYLLHNPYFKGFLGKDGLSILHHETIGVQDTCCIFETYMDFLSYKTLESNGHKLMDTPVPCDYILLHTADYLHNCLQRLVSYKEIHLYLHHSLSGHTMKDTIYGLYKDKTIDESFRYIDDVSLTKYLQYRR